MPPQINFTKEAILQEAFEIVRKEGQQALTARRIAQRLNCSTQPVYSAFASMKELTEAVRQKAAEYGEQYLLQEELQAYPFLSIGLRYVRFAREERELFKMVYLSGNAMTKTKNVVPSFERFIERMKQEPVMRDLDDTRLLRMFHAMQIFTHGLIMLSISSEDDTTEAFDEFAKQAMMQMGRTMIEWECMDQLRTTKNQQLKELGVVNLADNAPRVE